MTSKQISIGTVDYPGPKKTVSAAVDVVELSATLTSPVKSSTAEKWRTENNNIEFVVQAPRYLWEEPKLGTPLPGVLGKYGGFRPSQENLELWKKLTDAAVALQANIAIFLTSYSFTPTKPNRDAFASFLNAARSLTGADLKIAWEPKGPWDMAFAADFAVEQNIILAVDPLRDNPSSGRNAYFRLGPFASMGSRMSLYNLERIKEAAMSFESTICIFETQNALDDVRNLKKLIG